jgi:hypothetical protein
MTVGAYDVALADLFQHKCPWIVAADHLTHIEPLVSDVIELEHERVGLTAVNAGV